MSGGRWTRLLGRRNRLQGGSQDCSSRPVAVDICGDERGFTLIELVVAMALSVFIGAAALTFIVVTFDQSNTINSRAVASDQAEVGLEQLERDLREAMTSVSVSASGSSTSISFQIPTPGTDSTGESVTWTCPSTAESSTYFAGACTRTLNGTTKTEIAGVQSMLFSPIGSSGSALSLPVSNSTSVASVGMTLTVQITDYGLSTHGNAAAILPVDGQGAPATSTVANAPNGATAPIVLQATADLENFG
jgi:prepilin-type N-terminal cleavage/methylation domain-containing protein